MKLSKKKSWLAFQLYNHDQTLFHKDFIIRAKPVELLGKIL